MLTRNSFSSRICHFLDASTSLSMTFDPLSFCIAQYDKVRRGNCYIIANFYMSYQCEKRMCFVVL